MGSPAIADSAWRDDAACIGADPRIFTDPRPGTGDARRAVEICQTCPVKQPCLDTALKIEAPADVGIWGGTTPESRSHLRRAHSNQAAAPPATQPSLDPAREAIPTGAVREPIEVHVDGHGDYTDRTGRVIIFEIHGEPPYMLMIDGKPTARTTTIHDAASLAGRLLTRERPPVAIHPQTDESRRQATSPQQRRA